MKKIFTLISVAAMALAANANVWLAPAEAPEAGATIVDDALITANTAFATKISENKIDEETKVFEWKEISNDKRMDVRVDAAPSTANPTGTDKGNATPIIITPKENVSVTFVYRRQVGNGYYDGGDGKDLKVCSQADFKTMTSTAYELIEDIDGSYGNAAQSFTLKAGQTYVVYGRGTTIGMFGFIYEVAEVGEDPVDPDDPIDPVEPTEDKYAAYITAACPANATAYWYNAANAADYVAPVGTFVAADGVSVNYANVEYMTIRVNGKASELTGDRIDITPTADLKEGNVIAVRCYRNKDTDAGASLAIVFDNGSKVVLGDGNDNTEINNVALGKTPNTFVYTVTAAEAGSKTLSLYREKASTNIFVVAFQITTETPAGINDVIADAADAASFNVMGQRVNASYKGIVIKNGKKFMQR